MDNELILFLFLLPQYSFIFFEILFKIFADFNHLSFFVNIFLFLFVLPVSLRKVSELSFELTYFFLIKQIFLKKLPDLLWVLNNLLLKFLIFSLIFLMRTLFSSFNLFFKHSILRFKIVIFNTIHLNKILSNSNCISANSTLSFKLLNIFSQQFWILRWGIWKFINYLHFFLHLLFIIIIKHKEFNQATLVFKDKNINYDCFDHFDTLLIISFI